MGSCVCSLRSKRFRSVSEQRKILGFGRAIMHLSMLSPRVEGGAGYPREID